jgi:hypothetical protein
MNVTFSSGAAVLPTITSAPLPRQFPSPMARYGKNPYGEHLYRIVFAPSVMRLVGGLWPDGKIEYRLRPKYRELGDVWVLEKWISALKDSGMTEETYNFTFTEPGTGLLLNGPYPKRGVYQHVHTFETVQPADCNLDWLIGLINKAESNDPAKVKAAVEAHYLKKENAEDSAQFDRIKESMPAFGLRPTSFRPTSVSSGVHTQKTYRVDQRANRLRQPNGRPMPIGRNKAVVG